VAGYKLSGEASADVEDIFEYTIVNFGIEQARAYLHALGDRFKALVEDPLRGRTGLCCLSILMRNFTKSDFLKSGYLLY